MNSTSNCWRHVGRHFARCSVVLGLAAMGSGIAGHAWAGCGQPALPMKVGMPSVEIGLAAQAAYFMTSAHEQAPVQRLRVTDGRDAGIVGTWRVTFVSDGTAYPAQIPYGAVVDFATVQWHSDGTEFMISGARPPSSGDVCMGSWQQIGPSTYKLKHIALAWASSDSMPPATPPVFVGPAIIRETVRLNRARDTYEGTFTIDQYAQDEVTLLQHIGGKIIGKRFSVD